MEKLKFKNSEQKYNVIFQRSGNRIQIEFEDAVSSKIDTSELQLVIERDQEQDLVYAEYNGYIYKYKTLSNGFILSNIDEVYTEPIAIRTPNIHVPSVEEIVRQLELAKESKQNQNKSALSIFLASNPITFTDGLKYGVTQEDQDEMIADKAAYDLKKSLGDTTWRLEWHSLHGACREFTVAEFMGLLNAIVDFVYPYRKLQEKYKEQIYACKSVEELDAIELKYEISVVE